MQRERLDQRIAQRGLAESRVQAGNLMKQGLVTVDGGRCGWES
ncbi:MAG: S4 domain-containing protein [Planctomycetaceae bacterium]